MIPYQNPCKTLAKPLNFLPFGEHHPPFFAFDGGFSPQDLGGSCVVLLFFPTHLQPSFWLHTLTEKEKQRGTNTPEGVSFLLLLLLLRGFPHVLLPRLTSSLDLIP